MITDIEAYFIRGCGRCERFDTPDCVTRTWAGGLASLRRICREAGLQEAVKWGHPCYVHAGRNIALIGALKGGFSLGFFNPALMTDPEGVMERQGPNTRHPDVIRFGQNDRPAAMEPVLRAYLAEAMGYAEAGILPQKTAPEVDLPETLVSALGADPELAEAFHALTPGRQRGYVINLGTTKNPATQTARIARFRDRILAGKGVTERGK